MEDSAFEAQGDLLARQVGAQQDPLSGELDVPVSVDGSVHLDDPPRPGLGGGGQAGFGSGDAGAAHDELAQIGRRQPGGAGSDELAAQQDVDASAVRPDGDGPAAECRGELDLLVVDQDQAGDRGDDGLPLHRADLPVGDRRSR
ncbi:hypothetical protein ACFQ6N_17240 [Kitasatospora sp. NPDC056446]|uniref:hypothetical protein n=1 Tax=Kitasatospora sp. NPDC056446 TaxID=3345819 RepID=UPI0036C52111